MKTNSLQQRRPTSWLHQITQRRRLAMSGLLAFLSGSTILRTAESTINKPSWYTPLQNASIAQILFWILLVYGLIWILITLYGLWKLASSADLQNRFKAQWWSHQPVLVQIAVFVEHWIFATVYVFLTGDLERGVVLAFLSILHIVVALLLAPRLVQVT